jgi:hypothetical protein
MSKVRVPQAVPGVKLCSLVGVEQLRSSGRTYLSLLKVCPMISVKFEQSAAVSVAALTAPVIRIRPPAANSTSIAPPPADLTGSGGVPDSEPTIAGTKPMVASPGSGRNDRRHRSSNEREMPYRRAVAATWRGVCKLSRTILSFSSSDQRRRRPVSTISSRSTWALRLSLSISTVLNTARHSARRPSAEAYFLVV